MTDADFHVPPFFDYGATLAWAMSGALVGIRKHFDFTGVFVIALLSATGGGLLRDALFLRRIPAFLLDPNYLIMIAATTALIALFTRPLAHLLVHQTTSKLIDLVDALGIPAFAVVGMQLAEAEHIPVVGVAFVGVVNGVAGGLLRDVVVRDVPALLRPGQFVSLALAIACALFLALRLVYRVGTTDAAWTMVGFFFLIRVLAVHFNWQTRAIIDEPPAGHEPK